MYVDNWLKVFMLFLFNMCVVGFVLLIGYYALQYFLTGRVKTKK